MSLKCDVCGDPAMTSVLKDPFGKSDQTSSFCAVHAPTFSALRTLTPGTKPTVSSKTMDHASEALSAFMAQLGEIMSMEDGATPADYLQRARDIREWCHDHQTPLNFVDALKIAEAVFEQYQKDQPKWWRRMDGTPILNDVAVRMAEAFRGAAGPAPETRCVGCGGTLVRPELCDECFLAQKPDENGRTPEQS